MAGKTTILVPSVRDESHPLVREIRVTLILLLLGAGTLMLLDSFGLAQRTRDSLKGKTSTLHSTFLEHAPQETDVMVTAHHDIDRAVTAGQKDVQLFSFTLSARKAAKVQNLSFSLGELANPTDVQSLQLFIDGEFFAERAFFEGKGTFKDVHLRLYPYRDVRIDVMGQVHENAPAGHRLQIGFESEDDLFLQSIASEPLESNLNFPVWGPAVSVIGQPL